MAGPFITFEGSDGAGKTTQLNLLAGYLERHGYVVCCTREPGGTALGDKIRSLLLDPAHREMAARTEALLYMAARAQHVTELIGPALARGEVVLCDRYADSTMVYQGVARKLRQEELAAINRFATGGLIPDLTILLDCDGWGRVASRGGPDRIEQEAAGFHAAVRQGFLQLAAAESQRIKLVAAGGTIAEVRQTVAGLVEEFLSRRARREDR